jgi:protein-S-isoprenylcysteine O-methyltransferase Ste14
MGRFQLSKWYMDCVGDDGQAVVAYVAELRWRRLTLHYASVLQRLADEAPRVESTVRASSRPELVGETLEWSSAALGFEGRWMSLAPPIGATLFESPLGRVKWICHQPRARGEIMLRGRALQGLGYTEHLSLTIEPWRMPIDELRWGRFIGQRSALVWIDWRGPQAKGVVFLDSSELGPAHIDERSVVSEGGGGVRLEIEPGHILRRGAIGETALANVPGLRHFPPRILAVDEVKWCARATLQDAHGRDHGWVIHEVVRWPPAQLAPPGSRRIAKALYGLLFAAVLPALLVAWARATEAVVRAPACHGRPLGIALCLAGAVLVGSGWFALWQYGGGLPMNAFPPPRFVHQGIYAVLSHPIYTGFAALCFGASIATGSESGLWLVAPSVVLGSVALVAGYERHDLNERFGVAREHPWLWLPRADDSPPPMAASLSAYVIAVLPWVVASALHARWMDAGAYAFVLAAPLAVGTGRALRAFVVRALLAVALMFSARLLAPSMTPSSIVPLALLAADAWASRFPRGRLGWRVLAVALAAGGLTGGRACVVAFATGVAAYVLVVNAGALWAGLRGLAERVANSWREVRFGRVRFINHGMWAGLATFGGVVIIGTLIGAQHLTAILVAAFAALLGAGLWAQTIEGSPALSRPYGFYGGLLGICLAAIAGPWLGTPVWLLLGAYAVAGPYVQAMGRMRCLVQGCCHGRETGASIGIRYRHPRSRVCRLAHLTDVPIHPTPLYSILWNGVTMLVVARLWALHEALHLVGGVYLILNGSGRFVEEAYRGEPQTPILARLRLYQWVALGTVIAGALVTALGSSGATPVAAPNRESVVAGAIFGLLTWFAMGVDFPESNRRYSRLA